MDHLSGLDATFLYMETAETPMHVGSLNLYQLPAGYQGEFVDDLRAHIAMRMHLVPVFQRKLVNMPFELANPIWVTDDDVDLEYHIRSTVLPKPGNREQLDRLVGRLHSSLLDRSRPLWEFYVIEGVQSPPDAPPGTRYVAFYSKLHHAAIDGGAGVALTMAITDTSPVPRAVRPAPLRRHTPADQFGIAELAGSGLRNTAVQAIKLIRTLPALARTALRMLRPTKGPAAEHLPGTTEKLTWFAPKTPLNVSITNQRIFSSFSLPLDELKQISKGNGATLNDVVLAICSGALRQYLADLNCVPEQSLLAGVPVSLREEGNTQMNTQASMMRINLASIVTDPLQRLAAIRHYTQEAKALTASVKSVLPTDFPSLGAPWLISGIAGLFGRSKLANTLPPVTNLAISNVPGPRMPLYLAGAKMLTYYPVSIVVHGVALNVTVQSYNGAVDFGLIACRKAMPDLPELAKYMQAAHRELLELTHAAQTQQDAPSVAPAREPTKAATAATERPGTRVRPKVLAKAVKPAPRKPPPRASASKPKRGSRTALKLVASKPAAIPLKRARKAA